jgi:N-acetylneuraminic acid mutarotase
VEVRDLDRKKGLIKIQPKGVSKVEKFLRLALIWFAIFVVISCFDSRRSLPWQTRASMPTMKSNFAFSAVGGKLYTFGGNTPQASPAWIDEVTEYDPARDSWVTKAPMPSGRIDMGLAVLDDKIYIIGGRTSEGHNGVNTVDVYDPSTDTWIEKEPMPTARWGLGCAVLDGRIYAIDGTQTRGTTNDMEVIGTVEVYDPESDAWTEIKPMPDPRFGITCAPMADKILVFGGAYNRLEKSNSVEEYDPSNDTCKELGPMPIQRSRSRCFAFKRQVCVVGGDPSYRDISMYDPASDSWKSMGQMAIDRDLFGCALIDNSLYVFGGYCPGGKGYLDSMTACRLDSHQ